MPDKPPKSIAESRRHQMFPTLESSEIDRIRRFGELRRYRRGERMFAAGELGPGMFVVLKGVVAITQRDGLGRVVPIVEQGPGEFLAEVGQLSGHPALVDGYAEADVETILVPPERLRALLIAEADLGERITRALILRRVALIEAGASGAVLIGQPGSAGVTRLESFLRRNGYPYRVLSASQDVDAAALVEQYGAALDQPLAVCPDGSVLINPSEDALARCLGMVDMADRTETYDVAVVGAGPAGLATAVYAASEGLRVAVLDARAYGGQAGASARIENYLGFPTGISGQALAGRAYVQAQKFGADMLIPATVAALDCRQAASEGILELMLADGRRLKSKTVVIASGARYRRPSVPGLADFEGRGVWYWASPIEAKMCVNEQVVLVGGGNSAGQAAVFLSGHAAKVFVLIRGPGLAASMSRYLIDRLASTPNIQLCTHSELIALAGSAADGLTAVTWRNRASGETQQRSLRNVFVFVGADPETHWLDGCGVTVDAAGFVMTGRQSCVRDGGAAATPLPLETSVPGVFAVGDVRSGSVKRVGGAIGEGAAVVAQIHQHLSAMQSLTEAVA